MGKFDRTKLLIGNGLEILQNSSVALFGVGGVGGFVAEALIRSGIGSLTVFDGDKISESNINRQIIADCDGVGADKVDVIKNRLLKINPKALINTEKVFYLPENADKFDLSKFDYIIDAVDTVTAKLEIIKRAKEKNIPVISCMGTGGKTDLTKLRVGFIEQTNTCPLARVMRRELKNLGISKVKVVYSEEMPIKEIGNEKNIPSMIFVPASAGLLIAKEVIFDLINKG